MTKKNANPGCGTRFDQPDAIEEKEKRQSPQQGIFLPYICQVCGKPKKGFNHSKCSKILQKQRIENDLKKAK